MKLHAHKTAKRDMVPKHCHFSFLTSSKQRHTGFCTPVRNLMQHLPL